MPIHAKRGISPSLAEISYRGSASENLPNYFKACTPACVRKKPERCQKKTAPQCDFSFGIAAAAGEFSVGLRRGKFLQSSLTRRKVVDFRLRAFTQDRISLARVEQLMGTGTAGKTILAVEVYKCVSTADTRQPERRGFLSQYQPIPISTNPTTTPRICIQPNPWAPNPSTSARAESTTTISPAIPSTQLSFCLSICFSLLTTDDHFVCERIQKWASMSMVSSGTPLAPELTVAKALPDSGRRVHHLMREQKMKKIKAAD